MRKHTQTVRNFLSEVAAIGGTVCIRRDVDNVVAVKVVNVPHDIYNDVLFKVQMMLYSLPGGHSWGTDGIGYIANKSANFVEVMKVLQPSFAKEMHKVFEENGKARKEMLV